MNDVEKTGLLSIQLLLKEAEEILERAKAKMSSLLKEESEKIPIVKTEQKIQKDNAAYSNLPNIRVPSKQELDKHTMERMDGKPWK